MTSPIPLPRVLATRPAVHELHGACRYRDPDFALILQPALELLAAVETLGRGDILRVGLGDALLDQGGLRVLEGEAVLTRVHAGHEDGDPTAWVVILEPDAALLALGVGRAADEALGRLLRGDLGDVADGLSSGLDLALLRGLGLGLVAFALGVGGLGTLVASRLVPDLGIGRSSITHVTDPIAVGIALVVHRFWADVAGVTDLIAVDIALTGVEGVGAVVLVIGDTVLVDVHRHGGGGIGGRGLCVGRVGSQSGQKHQKQKLERVHVHEDSLWVMCHRHGGAIQPRSREGMNRVFTLSLLRDWIL